MGLRKSIRSGWRQGVCAAAFLCGIVQVSPAKTNSPKLTHHTELTPWEQAEHGREVLEVTPPGSRTRADYTRAMDAFRAVYHSAPGDMHAPDSVNAVAELLAEQGRGMHDPKSLKAAVGQYEFLRRQYPGSSLRVGALLSEGQIFENDLHDSSTAREAYTLLLQLYPRSELAEEAKAGLDSLKQGVGNREEGVESSSRPAVHGMENARAGSESRPSGEHAAASSFVPMPTTGEENAAARRQPGDKTSTTPNANGDAGETTTAEQHATSHIAQASGKRRGQLARVTGIRHWSTPDYTRVAIDLGDDVTYEAARVPNPDRIYFDLHGTRLAQELAGKSFAVTDDGFLKKIRAAQFSNDMTRVVLDVNDVTEYSAFLLPNPYRLIIDIHGGSKSEPPPTTTIGAPQRVAAPAPTVPNTTAVKASSSFDVAALSAQPGRVEATSQPTSKPIAAVVDGQGANEQRSSPASSTGDMASATARNDGAVATPSKKTRHSRAAIKYPEPGVPARPAVPTADGQTSLVRALGLKIGRIVIDPGHGGHDSGTLGVDGLEEKDVVLDVALRLGRLLHDRLGSEIIYTRSDDTFIPLETRTAIANKAQADLFLSIHANSSADARARGVETYYLNFTSSPDALQTAARENAVSDQSIYQLSDLVKKIALKDKIAESREFAGDVEKGLYGGLQKGNAGLKDRGVKKAPFVVLIGANMPSVLAEISFVTNPRDAGQLQQPEYRERVAESLYRGIAKYEEGLSGVKLPTERASRAE